MLRTIRKSAVTVAALGALAYWVAGAGRGTLALSGIATGLALLSKAPAGLLVPFVVGVAALQSLPRRSPGEPSPAQRTWATPRPPGPPLPNSGVGGRAARALRAGA